MTWIEERPPTPDSGALFEAFRAAMAGYPAEYSAPPGEAAHLPEAVKRDSIVRAHSLIPEALQHVFSGYRSMLDPKLPLGRRQHEMIATVVSALNYCHY